MVYYQAGNFDKEDGVSIFRHLHNSKMKIEDQLIQLSHQWDKAMVSNDAAEIEKFMSPDWVIVGSDGITSRESFIANISSGALTHHRMDADEIMVRSYGDSAIVIARGTSAGSFKGHTFEFYEWSTSVFVKQAGGWKCVTTMLTPAEK